MARRRAILWFRQDLRMHDNEAFVESISSESDMIPVYIFDERIFGGKTLFGFDKTGAHRAQFVIDCILDLRKSLEALGSRLIVRVGKPEEELFKIAHQFKTSWVYCNRERTTEEKFVQDTLEKNLWSIGQEIRYSRGKMLYYTADLPFPITHTPDSYTTFRKEVEKIVQIRQPIGIPDLEGNFPKIEIENGQIPNIEDFALTEPKKSKGNNQRTIGGEDQGLSQLSSFINGQSGVPKGKITYNESVMHFNSKMSAYLAQGCVSPKKMFYTALHAVDENKKAPIFQQIFQRLMYRDYLRLMGKKYDAQIFLKGGVSSTKETCPREIPDSFYQWANGQTGQPLIDAIMNQLNTTGFCSHHARKLSATFLVRELNLHWRWGASWFETQLIDYDVCSNWVNWMNIAGFGPDQKEERKVNYELQSKRLDPAGTFVEQWG